jgi:hypothetical protein
MRKNIFFEGLMVADLSCSSFANFVVSLCDVCSHSAFCFFTLSDRFLSEFRAFTLQNCLIPGTVR